MIARLRGQRGQGLVETALVLPLILLLFMGLFDFGRAIFYYNSVSEAARNGVRVAIVNQTQADICQVAAERASGLGLPTTCAPNANAVGVWVTSTSGVGGSCTSLTPGGSPCFQTVQVTAQFRAITPIISSILGQITVRSDSRLPVESICQGSGCPRT